MESPNEFDAPYGGPWYAHPPLRNALIAGALTGAAFAAAHLGAIPHIAERIIYAVAIPIGGYHWAFETFEELIDEREIGIGVLMLAATAGSMILGMWDEAAFLVCLYGAAEGLEEYAYARTRHSIRELLDLAPATARVLVDGEETPVGAEELQIGDVFIVRPGENIPTDGTIIEGRSSINQAPVTGESVPVDKRQGDDVFAGTINQEGALQVRATATYEDNTLARMIHLVEQAHEQKGRGQLFIERFGRVYTPLVLAAAGAMVVASLVFGPEGHEWARRAVVLLVAAAPCALVMSTPVAIAAAIGTAGRNGVLIKGGAHLENLGRVTAVAFDKTGTLTAGRPEVTDVVAFDGDETEVLSLAYSVERLSEHPLGRAIARRAEHADIEVARADDFRAVAGYGAEGVVAGRQARVGKPGFFENMGYELAEIQPTIDAMSREGKTIVLIGHGETIRGIIALRDELRPSAPELIAQLKQAGLTPAVISGDNRATVEAITDRLGIETVFSELKPEDKVRAVEALQRRYGPAVTVGDGINDAPALARSTVGVAMGAAGTDAAIEAADAALMGDELTKVMYAVRLGRRARAIGLQNIVFSVVTLAVLIPLAVSGLISVAAAVLAHEATELLAVANGLRAGIEAR